MYYVDKSLMDSFFNIAMIGFQLTIYESLNNEDKDMEAFWLTVQVFQMRTGS